MSRIRWGLAVLAIAALAGCGGGSDDPAPAPVEVPVPVPVPTGTTPITLTAATPAATFAALDLKVNVGSVAINSPPVVHFSITDADGNPVIGFGSTSQSATATLPGYANLAFSLAKLIPAKDGAPSKWVSYIVTTVPTKNATTGVVTDAAPTRPSTDNTGTLVDNKNGTYSYTFYRDITQVKAQVTAMTVTGANNKDDLGDLTYDPAAVHRLTIQVSGNAPGTGTNVPDAKQVVAGVPLVKPLDVIYDFVPATGKAVIAADASREVVAVAKCNECHRQLGGIPGLSEENAGAGFHGGSRNETRYCVVCHTEQRKYGRPEAVLETDPAKPNTFTAAGTNKVDGRAVGNLPNLIHKTHMGAMLAKKNYNFGGVVFNEVKYPQDVRNCTKCHDGSDTSTAKTAQGDNWKNNPSALACGACHDGINFTTGKGVILSDAAKGLTSTNILDTGRAHPATADLTQDDSKCALCHNAQSIDVAHLPVTPPNKDNALLAAGTNTNTNSAWIASNTSRLPAGAIKVTYDIKSVARDGNRNPVMVFRMLQNGTHKNLNVFAAGSVTEVWDGFMGAPSVYFVYAVPQDGVAAPADFNGTASVYLRCLWNGTAGAAGCGVNGAGVPSTLAGTLSAPDADGYYTATITGAVIPDNAVMLTGGLGFSYNVKTTLPLTQTNLADYPVEASTAAGLTAGMPNKTGGLIVIAPNESKVASLGCGSTAPGACTATGSYVGRRPIVEDKRCNACHQELGTFTEDAFHAGQRNDGTTCSWCHNPNRASSGWSADSASFVHAIHGGAKRTVPFNWHATSATENFSGVKYPGILGQCETCHLPGTYDFSAPASVAAVPNRLFRTVATGTIAASISTPPSGFGSTGAPGATPGFVPGTAYGAGPAVAAATGVLTPAVDTTLVDSPIATACLSCHDGNATPFPVADHIKGEGGSVYEARSTALPKQERCLICHGPTGDAAIKAKHSK